ncbi:cyclic lactone autoinducer peptide [Natranaerobius thermophilus]|uniref:Cyclic lactone autoinducer peptide n=1 Tax=Natranaerobius thermophilus (strain ATCC BAA-1301 / DSM 18059 / JW/NM-WN-LF) TaxID=457570 RepID=B2A270_NATTJ|nr:cyclic lactone autoinducer peptide [Natranaerobius thermophilus]ACB86178.1 hypothetical protein Nther_2622 [Natranaerobius thermophilus JW/NM-WN-LF]
MKRQAFVVIAKVLSLVALLGVSTASIYYLHEPEVPTKLKKYFR